MRIHGDMTFGNCRKSIAESQYCHIHATPFTHLPSPTDRLSLTHPAKPTHPHPPTNPHTNRPTHPHPLTHPHQPTHLPSPSLTHPPSHTPNPTNELSRKSNLGFELPTPNSSRETCFQKTRFLLVPDRPMSFRRKMSSDSNSPPLITRGKHVFKNLDFYWFSVDQWVFEEIQPQFQTPEP
jgi:hypothetical protein